MEPLLHPSIISLAQLWAVRITNSIAAGEEDLSKEEWLAYDEICRAVGAQARLAKVILDKEILKFEEAQLHDTKDTDVGDDNTKESQ